MMDSASSSSVLAGVIAGSVVLFGTSQSPQQFRTGVEIVEVTATVTDERGRLVTNLTRDDFTILEDGQPQQIAVFSRVDVLLPAPGSAPASPGRSLRVAEVATNDVRPDGRVFALILDDQLTQPFRTLSVRRLAREFVERHVGLSDLVGVFSTGGRGVLTQEFTTDHARVLRAIEAFQGNRIRRGPETDPERVYGIETAMDAVAGLGAHLQGVRGRRVAALYVSEGIDYNIYEAMKASPLAGGGAPGGLTNTATVRADGPASTRAEHSPEPTAVIRAIQRAMDALARSNVVVYGLDPRGLYSPDGEWLEYNPQDRTAVPPPTREEHARSIESLRVVSERTGGFALVNTNDFGDLFRRVVAESSQYYVLGYSPSRPGKPGEYHRITVRARSGLRVAAREGYVVPPPRPVAPVPRPVLAALDDSLPLPHLPLRVQAIPLPPAALDAPRRPVQVIVEIDGGGLAFAEGAGGFSERLEMAVKTLDSLAREENRSATEMTLPPLSAAQRDRMGRAGVRWLTTVELAPGRHSLRVASHATNSGRTGSVFVDVDVPPTGGGELRFSELALTASSASETPTAGTASNLPPLSGPPTTRRVFRIGETITVGAAIESTAPAPSQVTATVVRITGESETPIVTGPARVSRLEGEGESVVFSVATSALQPGWYAIRLASQPGEGAAISREIHVQIVSTSP
jgi:VWFA-related protein